MRRRRQEYSSAAYSVQHVLCCGSLIAAGGGALYLTLNEQSSVIISQQPVGKPSSGAAGPVTVTTVPGETETASQALHHEQTYVAASVSPAEKSRSVVLAPTSVTTVSDFMLQAKSVQAYLAAQATPVCEFPRRPARCTINAGAAPSCLLWDRMEKHCATMFADKDLADTSTAVAAFSAWQEVGSWVKHGSNALALQEEHGDAIADIGKYLNATVKYATDKRRYSPYCYEDAGRSYLQYVWEAQVPGMQRWKGTARQFSQCLRMTLFFAGDSLSNQLARAIMLVSMGHRPECTDGLRAEGQQNWAYRCGDFQIVFKRLNTPVIVDQLNRTKLDSHLQGVLTMYVTDPAPRKYLILAYGHWHMPWTSAFYKIPFVHHMDKAGVNWLQSYKFAVRFVLQEVKEFIGQKGCHECVYWMTTPPRHAKGWFRQRRSFRDACDWEQDVPSKEFEVMNAISASIAQNIAVRPLVLGETEFSILEAEALLGLRPDAHLRFSLEANQKKIKRDCLHYCIPGPWTDVAMNFLSRACSSR
eukprot:TRINITY_DN49268_c0_g1_i1.p1 TRINITY_DN49268_c0_g1~~TRINITY_DN49268_c0_g1_i1.p1  ORF type:complete len:529 (+),score=70.66 TRINITY_DN49268_c0_g1_i1:107-1693(+)